MVVGKTLIQRRRSESLWLFFSDRYAELLSIFLLSVLCLGTVFSSAIAQSQEAVTSETGEAAAPDPSEGVVQVLAYRGDDLLNQVSGFLVADGIVISVAHIADSADRLVVQAANGDPVAANVLSASADRDLLVLTAPDLDSQPLLFSIGPVNTGTQVRSFGFWAEAETERRRNIFRRSAPDFNAQVHSVTRSIPGIVGEASQAGFVHLSPLGRGGYGGPVIDSCGSVLGVNHAPLTAGRDAYWAHRTAGPEVSAADYIAVTAFLASLDIDTRTATDPCMPGAAAAAIDEAREQAEREREAREAEERRRREAETEARREREAREDAERRAEEAQRDRDSTAEASRDALAELSSQLSQGEVALATERERVHTRNMIIAGALILVSLLIVLSIILAWRGVAARRRASAELERAERAFGVCALTGTDSTGQSIALKVLGKDLAHAPDGLRFGRNPDHVDIVIVDETVSRVHGRFIVRDEVLHVEDLGSSGGTIVNEQRLAPSHPEALMTGDSLKIGGVELTLSIQGN